MSTTGSADTPELCLSLYRRTSVTARLMPPVLSVATATSRRRRDSPTTGGVRDQRYRGIDTANPRALADMKAPDRSTSLRNQSSTPVWNSMNVVVCIPLTQPRSPIQFYSKMAGG